MTTDPVDLKEACRTVLEGFDKEVFIRNTVGDHKQEWLVDVLRYLQALSVLDKYCDYTKDKPNSP